MLRSLLKVFCLSFLMSFIAISSVSAADKTKVFVSIANLFFNRRSL